jgi:hypothetical protein
MYSHVVRSETFSFFGFTRYQLSAQIRPTAEELALIRYHGLHRLEIFHDPLRDDFDAAAAAAHEKAKAHGLFVAKPLDAAQACLSEVSALTTTIRAVRAFNITLGDLLHGVTITHRSLRAIEDMERIIVECIDEIDRSLQTARNYSDQTEDIYAPGTEGDVGTPPRHWTRTWRR